MPDITYTGMADTKEFTKEDIERVGVTDQDAVTFTQEEPTQSVSDAFWAWVSNPDSLEATSFTGPEADLPTEAGLNPDAPSSDADPATTEPTGTDPAGTGSPGTPDGTDRAKAGKTGRGTGTTGD